MKPVSSVEKYGNSLFRVTEDVARAADGFEIKRAVVRHPGSATVFAVDEKKRVLLVEQFRMPAGKKLWEIPAGKIDEGESPLQAAKRELKEETGYRARKWTKLALFWPSPGFLAERTWIYLAEQLIAGAAEPMEDERIQLRWFEMREIDKLVREGKLPDGKTMLAFLTWKRYFAAKG